ncbi:telomerase reverse transcriptase-like [Cotesia glomerata]|uniref:telomerase reverse transcriptase-like n=1 Tax=Cotesia glomerata TaxID=32391 RepID=UPI001D02A0E4|nr:telomerase reverse transcriptase-like [Cotesia glomerata]XP_044576277.1 telomerase reverse transcriptase-like [Cotesia glomerata]
MNDTSENSNFVEIRKRHGPDVVNFLVTKKVILKEDIFGSYSLAENFSKNEWNFKLPSVKIKNDKVRKKNKIKLYAPKKHDKDQVDNLHLYANFRRSIDIISGKPESGQASASSTSKGEVSHPRSISKFAFDFKTKKIITQNLNGMKCHEHKAATLILKEDRGFLNILNKKSPEYKSCHLHLSSIMLMFAKKSRQFRYNIFLDRFSQDKYLLEGQLSQKQVYEFFSKILYHIVPNQLFGSKTNNAKIKRTLRQYLESGSEEFTLEKLLLSMDIDSINWLDKVSLKSNKMYLLAQVLYWFFDKFIWHIIYSYLYCEKPQAANYEKIIIHRWIKRGTIHQHMLNKTRENVYEPIPNDEAKTIDGSLVPKLRFYAKKSGLRPVLVKRTDESQKKQSKIFQNILKRLYLSTNPPQKPHITQRIWEEICNFRQVNGDKPLWFVCCDIKDAYGSIIQNKLLEVAGKLLDDNLPEVLTSKPIALLRPTRETLTDFVEYECLGLDYFPPLLPSSSLYCPINPPNKYTTIVSREEIKQFIKDEVLNKLVRLRSKYFKLKQGIGQGLPLSAVLSEIYYNDMEVQELQKFKNLGSLYRYVDDFLYLTDNREAAEKFWKMTQTGIQSYNCNFKIEKSLSNLDSVDKEEFSYLGFCYNIKTMEVRPDYSGVPVRYSLKMNKETGYKLLNLFIRRISKFMGLLKLYTFVLDPRIISKKTIIKTIRAAAKMSAERCFLLLFNMFDIKKLDRRLFFKIFLSIKKTSIKPLLKTCNDSLKVEGCHFLFKFTELQFIIWYEYMQAFKKNSRIAKRFIKLMKRQINFDLLKNIT